MALRSSGVVWRAALALVVLLGWGVLPVLAQTPTPNEINAVAKDLWCPLCNGVRLDNCELQACIQMREVIAQKLMAGESKEQIKAYFVQQYGDVVLGAPDRQGFNLVVWLFPALAVVVGLGWLVFLVRTWLRRQPAPVQAQRASQPTIGQGKDQYLRRVDEELSKYE
jgi:cytochrome c-type biogenesis protein CcmH